MWACSVLLRPLPSVQWFVGDVVWVFVLISLTHVQNSCNGYCAPLRKLCFCSSFSAPISGHEYSGEGRTLKKFATYRTCKRRGQLAELKTLTVLHFKLNWVASYFWVTLTEKEIFSGVKKKICKENAFILHFLFNLIHFLIIFPSHYK